MALHHKILAQACCPLRFLKSIGERVGRHPSDCLRVLLYHDIAPWELDQFRDQLSKLSKSWRFVTPKEFENMMEGREAICGRNILVTFDDGFASNRIAAEEVLNPMGIKAIFFVVTEFIALKNYQESRNFLIEHIQPGVDMNKLANHFFNMTWSDLDSLLSQGHYIGAHTSNHARLSQVSSPEDLLVEIVNCGNKLSKKLGVPIEHFAYTFGDIASFSEDALRVAAKRFKYIYSGLRGNNALNVSSNALRRDAIQPTDPDNLVLAFLEGNADFYYKRPLKKLDEWACKISMDNE